MEASLAYQFIAYCLLDAAFKSRMPLTYVPKFEWIYLVYNFQTETHKSVICLLFSPTSELSNWKQKIS